MEKRRIGSLEVSVVGLGTNNFGTEFFGNGCDLEATRAIVDAALDSGVTFFDTAEEYSVHSRWGTGHSEQFLGAALGSRREEVVIASKFQVESLDHPEQRGAERIRRAVEGSLERLGTDHIDLYQQHFPDPDTPIEETLGALQELVAEGKVREIGCANFTAVMIEEATDAGASLGGVRYGTVQNGYSVLDAPPVAGGGGSSDDDWVGACARHGLQMIPFFPLANGLLTGKYTADGGPPPDSRLVQENDVSQGLAESVLTEENLAIARGLEEYARRHGRSLLELAVSWLASQDLVATVIAGATRPGQVRANAEAAGWRLSAQELAEVGAIVAAGRREGADAAGGATVAGT